MALYTALSVSDARKVCVELGAGEPRSVVGIPAGSVNSNYRVSTDAGDLFVRIYEEQGIDGARYEWRLLAHLAERGVPVPRRLGPASAEPVVRGKVVAGFQWVEGHECCQAMVDETRAFALGEQLAKVHLALADFPSRRAGRFTNDALSSRLERVEALERVELTEDVALLREVAGELTRVADVPRGVIHGDLFRDNVRWDEGGRVAAVLDWESAADGAYLYDLAVAIWAWCYSDTLRVALAGALIAGYQSVRPLEPGEKDALRWALMSAAFRFAVTRITDYHLREAPQENFHWKDYRRFMQRLREARALPVASLRALCA